uniref:Uncharacterized protein n=1 Tax=Alexandrium monilatum TaxID=311494 RepID=A0A7S4SJU2_9DINO|mmetsp:Transcript_83366/g.260285  ORF Transcript_83366/g.260285 Transcript_83366/m.260285 type:complete len:140 (+) Transcript_83366:102-521(+)
MAGQPHFKPAYGFEPASPLGPEAEVGEAVPGLRAFLEHLGLEEHLGAANDWCAEMGAAVLLEVVESVEDLAEALPLDEGEAETLRRRARVAMSALETRGQIVAQEAVVPLGEDESFAFAGRTFIGKRKATREGGDEASA